MAKGCTTIAVEDAAKESRLVDHHRRGREPGPSSVDSSVAHSGSESWGSVKDGSVRHATTRVSCTAACANGCLRAAGDQVASARRRTRRPAAHTRPGRRAGRRRRGSRSGRPRTLVMAGGRSRGTRVRGDIGSRPAREVGGCSSEARRREGRYPGIGCRADISEERLASIAAGLGKSWRTAGGVVLDGLRFPPGTLSCMVRPLLLLRGRVLQGPGTEQAIGSSLSEPHRDLGLWMLLLAWSTSHPSSDLGARSPQSAR